MTTLSGNVVKTWDLLSHPPAAPKMSPPHANIQYGYKVKIEFCLFANFVLLFFCLSPMNKCYVLSINSLHVVHQSLYIYIIY